MRNCLISTDDYDDNGAPIKPAFTDKFSDKIDETWGRGPINIQPDVGKEVETVESTVDKKPSKVPIDPCSTDPPMRNCLIQRPKPAHLNPDTAESTVDKKPSKVPIDPCSTDPPMRNCLIQRPKPAYLNSDSEENSAWFSNWYFKLALWFAIALSASIWLKTPIYKPTSVHPDTEFLNGRPVMVRPIPKPTQATGLILPDKKPSAVELWKPFLESIGDFFETKKKDFIKLMGIMNGDDVEISSDMLAKPAYATGKLPLTVGQKGTNLIQVSFRVRFIH